LKRSPVFITLGSNVEPEKHLAGAARLLARQLTIRAASRVYETAPIGPHGEALEQGAFLNAAVLIESDIPPGVLKLGVLRPLEARLGRVRSADKYAPRPIDLDIALYGDLILDDPQDQITIPDPEIVTRAHIALPLADLASDFVHPVDGRTLAEIAAQFAGQAGITVHAMALRVVNGVG